MVAPIFDYPFAETGDNATAALQRAADGLLNLAQWGEVAASLPASGLPNQRIIVASTRIVHVWDSVGGTWREWMHVGSEILPYQKPVVFEGAASATFEVFLPVYATSFRVDALDVLCSNATTGSDGSNNWTFQITNITASLNLRATAGTTNANELAANTVKTFTTNQNQTLAANAVAKVAVTKTGSPTALGRVQLRIRGMPTG